MINFIWPRNTMVATSTRCERSTMRARNKKLKVTKAINHGTTAPAAPKSCVTIFTFISWPHELLQMYIPRWMVSYGSYRGWIELQLIVKFNQELSRAFESFFNYLATVSELKKLLQVNCFENTKKKSLAINFITQRVIIALQLSSLSLCVVVVKKLSSGKSLSPA